WLYGILRNLCHRHLRKQGRLVFVEELVLKETVQPSPADQLDQDFCATRLAQAVQNLSPHHREIIVLRYYENLKIEEIAMVRGKVLNRLGEPGRAEILVQLICQAGLNGFFEDQFL